jgi:hypothetical protein
MPYTRLKPKTHFDLKANICDLATKIKINLHTT